MGEVLNHIYTFRGGSCFRVGRRLGVGATAPADRFYNSAMWPTFQHSEINTLQIQGGDQLPSVLKLANFRALKLSRSTHLKQDYGRIPQINFVCAQKTAIFYKCLPFRALKLQIQDFLGMKIFIDKQFLDLNAYCFWSSKRFRRKSVGKK